MPTRKLHTVKELITSCDREKLCRQYLALYERPPEYTTVYLPYFMNKLYAIEPFLSSDEIVINTIVCEGGLDDLDTESYVFRIDDIVRFFEPIEAFDDPDASPGELFSALQSIRSKRPENEPGRSRSYPGWVKGFSYDFTEWEHILGWRVPDFAFSEENKYDYATVILAQMMAFGFDESDVIEHKKAIVNSLEMIHKLEAEPQSELPEGARVSVCSLENADTLPQPSKTELFEAIMQYRAVKQVYDELTTDAE